MKQTKKKVGIITFHFSKSHGALLQAYALCKVLNNINTVDAEIIDYKPFNIVSSKMGLNRKTLFHPKQFISYFLFIQLKIRKFIKRNIPISKRTFWTSNQLNSNVFKYDYFITGSDQVWNSKIFPVFDANYFLEFATKHNSTLISYAASFGQSQPGEYRKQMKELIDRIDFISVREVHGQKIVKDLTGRFSTLVLDPTLLLADYEEIINYPNIDHPYIAVYCLEETLAFRNSVDIISKGMNLPVVWLNSGISGKHIKGKYISHSSWLGLIKKANCVITNSFHGVAFSIIFNKNFYALTISNRFVRISDLLKTLDLENRIINNVGHLTIDEFSFEEINYKPINEILNNERIKSIRFLKDTLRI